MGKQSPYLERPPPGYDIVRDGDTIMAHEKVESFRSVGKMMFAIGVVVIAAAVVLPMDEEEHAVALCGALAYWVLQGLAALTTVKTRIGFDTLSVRVTRHNAALPCALSWLNSVEEHRFTDFVVTESNYFEADSRRSSSGVAEEPKHCLSFAADEYKGVVVAFGFVRVAPDGSFPLFRRSHSELDVVTVGSISGEVKWAKAPWSDQDPSGEEKEAVSPMELVAFWRGYTNYLRSLVELPALTQHVDQDEEAAVHVPLSVAKPQSLRLRRAFEAAFGMTPAQEHESAVGVPAGADKGRLILSGGLGVAHDACKAEGEERTEEPLSEISFTSGSLIFRRFLGVVLGVASGCALYSPPFTVFMLVAVLAVVRRINAAVLATSSARSITWTATEDTDSTIRISVDPSDVPRDEHADEKADLPGRGAFPFWGTVLRVASGGRRSADTVTAPVPDDSGCVANVSALTSTVVPAAVQCPRANGTRRHGLSERCEALGVRDMSLFFITWLLALSFVLWMCCIPALTAADWVLMACIIAAGALRKNTATIDLAGLPPDSSGVSSMRSSSTPLLARYCHVDVPSGAAVPIKWANAVVERSPVAAFHAGPAPAPTIAATTEAPDLDGWCPPTRLRVALLDVNGNSCTIGVEVTTGGAAIDRVSSVVPVAWGAAPSEVGRTVRRLERALAGLALLHQQ